MTNKTFLNYRRYTLPVSAGSYGIAGGGADDTAALNALFAEGKVLRAKGDGPFTITGPLIIPNGAIVEGDLKIIYDGPDSATALTIGDDVQIEGLDFDTSAASGVTATAGTGLVGGLLKFTGPSTTGGASFLTIEDTAGLDVDRFEFDGFQRPLVLGDGLTWKTGGRIGVFYARDYTRALSLKGLDGFTLEHYDIAGRNVNASYTSGHNGILIESLRNSTIGTDKGRIDNSGEHSIRLAGDVALGASYNNTFGPFETQGYGGSPFKINADVITYGNRIGKITATGTFTTSPGGNREGLRLSHLRDCYFDGITLLVADGATYSCQDAISINDADGVTIGHVHADGLNQSVLNIVYDQDVGDGLGTGDVQNIHIGGVTGTASTTAAMIAVSGDAAVSYGNITAAGVDYFTDGNLFNSNAAAVYDGPVNISGRLRKTDETALPATTNLPADAVVDVRVGEYLVVNNAGSVRFVKYDKLEAITGTAAAPSITFVGDPDTGLYSAAANQLGFATGGVARMLLNSTALQVDAPITGTAVTQTTTDSTAGRLLKTGDGGFLGNVIAYGSGQNFSDADKTQLIGSGSSAGAPADKPASEAYAGIHVRQSSTRWGQLLISLTTGAPRLWVRTYNGSVGAWDMLFSRATVLGTVSQASGVPTGALIENASGANGRTEKRASGAMEAYKTDLSAATVTTASGSRFKSADITWTFPTAFVEAPHVSASAIDADCDVRVVSVSTTAAVLVVMSDISKASPVAVSGYARGRWSTMT